MFNFGLPREQLVIVVQIQEKTCAALWFEHNTVKILHQILNGPYNFNMAASTKQTNMTQCVKKIDKNHDLFQLLGHNLQIMMKRTWWNIDQLHVTIDNHSRD